MLEPDPTTAATLSTSLTLSWPCPVRQVLAQQRHGGGDPSYAVDPDGSVWLAMRTPHGDGTLQVVPRPSAGAVEAHAWGDGAAWLMDALPGLIGAHDDVTTFDASLHPAIADAWRRHSHWRRGRSRLILHSLLPAIVEQKVTGKEAFAGWRDLVRRHGEPAPGPRAGLWVPPQPHVVASIPSWEWLKLHIDPARSRTLVTVARRATAIERLINKSPEAAEEALRSIPGVGVWTSAEVRQRSFGDPDAVSFGDYHVAKNVGWALTGSPATDEEMAVLLEPWRPHRGRIPDLIALAGLGRPRRGPRMSLPTHYPSRNPGQG